MREPGRTIRTSQKATTRATRPNGHAAGRLRMRAASGVVGVCGPGRRSSRRRMGRDTGVRLLVEHVDAYQNVAPMAASGALPHSTGYRDGKGEVSRAGASRACGTVTVLRHLLLAVASTVLALALLEVGLRATNVAVHDFAHDLEKYGSLIVWDDAGGYFRHVPEASAELGRVSVRFNSLGMRDREPRIPKPPGTFRVFCLGDSVTFGPGVPEDETFPARLRAELASVGVDVVVGAVQGRNSDQEEHFLAANIDRLAPDLVVLLYVVSDIEPTERMRLAYVPSTLWCDRAYRQLVLRSRLFEWGAFLYRGWTAHG